MVAYKGTTGPMKQFHEVDSPFLFGEDGAKALKAIEHRLGGHIQYVIPKFKGISEEQAKEFAEVVHFRRI